MSDHVKYTIIPGNIEEAVDIIGLMGYLGVKKVEVVLFENLFSRPDALPFSGSVELDIKYFPAGCGARRITKLVAYLLRGAPTVVCVGAQLAYQRIAFFLVRKKIKLMVYNRGLLADISKSPILSLRLLRTIPRCLRKYRLLNPYLADYSLVLGDSNGRMLRKYGVQNTYSVGLFPTRRGVIFEPNEARRFKKTTVVLITQAYRSHGMLEQANQQIIFLEKMIALLGELSADCILRVHPRDLDDYSSIVDVREINREGKQSFINRCVDMKLHGENVVLISPPSTFLVEWVNNKLQAILYKNSLINDIYESFYDSLKGDYGLSDSVGFLKPLFDIMELQYKEVNTENMGEIYSEDGRKALVKSMVLNGLL